MKNITEWFRALISPPSALVLAARELEEHKRRLLAAQSSKEYADGMVTYHAAAIKRLNNYLKDTQ